MNETLAAVSSLSAISFMARAWLSAELINSATVMPMSCTAGNEMTGRGLLPVSGDDVRRPRFHVHVRSPYLSGKNRAGEMPPGNVV